MRKMSLMKIKNYATYAKKRFTNDNKKESIAILLENTERLLITSAI